MKEYKNISHKAVSMNWQELATALRRAEYHISLLELNDSALKAMIDNPIGYETKDFNELLKNLGISRQELSKQLEMEYSSVSNQLAKSKPLPKWAKSMLLAARKLKESGI